VAATPRDASSAHKRGGRRIRNTPTTSDTAVRRISLASLRVAAATGRLLCRSSSTYLWISHRRRSLHPTRGRSQSACGGLTKPTEIGSDPPRPARFWGSHKLYRHPPHTVDAELSLILPKCSQMSTTICSQQVCGFPAKAFDEEVRGFPGVEEADFAAADPGLPHDAEAKELAFGLCEVLGLRAPEM